MTPLPTPRGGDRKVLAELTATVIVEIPAGEADDEITCPDCEECGIFTLHDDGACPSVRCQNCQHRIGVIVLERKQETRNVSETTRRCGPLSDCARSGHVDRIPGESLEDHVWLDDGGDLDQDGYDQERKP